QSDTGVNRIVSLNAAASGSQPLVFNGQGGVEFARIAADGKIGIGTDTPTAKLQVVGLASYADNAAAVAAGLTVGAFYHTAGTLKVVI
ncbi:MAG TPA: hypothetical protein VN428_14095, partial [Bryobacteraceae bacterium]|nr:hypothetical protein [Bryobacteraceae bacterium]